MSKKKLVSVYEVWAPVWNGASKVLISHAIWIPGANRLSCDVSRLDAVATPGTQCPGFRFEMSASNISFFMKAWVFCMLTIHVIAMGPLPLKRPRSINSQSTMDSGDHLWQYLESLEPAGREFSLGQLNDPHQVFKRGRSHKVSNFPYETVIDPQHVPETPTYNSTPAIDGRNLSVDRLANGPPPPGLWVDVQGRLPIPDMDHDNRQDCSELQNGKRPGVIGSYAHKIEGQSNPQSAHSRNTSQNIKEDSWMDSVYLLREDAELSPRAARRVPLALISPYYEQLKKAMDYFSRQGVEKEIIEQCNHLPVGTYRYKSLSSDPNFTSVNLIQNGKQISLTKKATTLSLKILIRWFFYSHSQLLKFLKIDPEGKSEAHRQALAWLISQVFEGKDGTPILGKISDRTGGGRFEFNKVQNLIIRSIACRRTESKSPGVSIFLLEFWYKNAKPKIWEKIINQCGSFSNLLRKLLIEEEEREKKKNDWIQRPVEYETSSSSSRRL